MPVSTTFTTSIIQIVILPKETNGKTSDEILAQGEVWDLLVCSLLPEIIVSRIKLFKASPSLPLIAEAVFPAFTNSGMAEY